MLLQFSSGQDFVEIDKQKSAGERFKTKLEC